MPFWTVARAVSAFGYDESPLKKFITVIILPLLINCIDKEKKELSGTLQVKVAILDYLFEGSGLPCVVFAGSENMAMTQDRRFAPVNGYECFILQNQRCLKSQSIWNL